MPDYRRHRIPGATYFFTVNLLDRTSSLLINEIDALRHVVARVRTLMPFHIDAWVVLPDHMHCLWTLPDQDGDFPKRWQAIKMGFSRMITPGEPLSASRHKRGERGIWQRRFWEHTIRDERDYAMHLDYIHFNPVKHGYVTHPADWKFSSFHRAVTQGVYLLTWSASEELTEGHGEPARSLKPPKP
jgi:putative transposase